MATAAQTKANRQNAQKSTGPKSEEGKARSCRNRLSHGFTSSALFIPGENPEEFNLLLADLHDEFQPATACEQILLEKMVQNLWLSLRAYRFQAIAMGATVTKGYIHKELALLIRYHQSSDRGFYKARTELLNAQKERKKSEIGFESQSPAEPAVPPRETAVNPELSVPATPKLPDFESPEDQIEDLVNAPIEEIAKKRIEELAARRKAA